MLPHLLLNPGGLISRGPGRNNESRDALLAGAGVRHGPDDDRSRNPAICDEMLLAVENEMVPVLLRGCSKCGCIRSGRGFGEEERAELLTRRESGKKALLLFVRAEARNHERSADAVGVDRHGNPRIGRGKLLHREAISDEPAVPAAIDLRHKQTHEARLSEFGIFVNRRSPCGVALSGTRQKHAGRRFPGVPAQRFLSFAQEAGA